MRVPTQTSKPSRLHLLTVVAIASLMLAPASAAARELASEAMREAIATDTLEEVHQAMLDDLPQRQSFDFDQMGMEMLGRDLVASGDYERAIEVLKINQAAFPDSPRAAKALADGFRAAGNDDQARVYDEMAEAKNPDRQAAAVAMGAMGDWELDSEAMQEAMDQMGVEMSPDQRAEMQEAMALMQAYSQDPEALRAAQAGGAAPPPQSSHQQSSAKVDEVAHESEFCEVLHRSNADKRITDASIRQRVEGHYGAAGGSLRTWNVETVCGDFLVAVPLWADVSPPILQATGPDSFQDSMGGRWSFTIGGAGRAASVTYTAADGTVAEMDRLGDPKSFD